MSNPIKTAAAKPRSKSKKPRRLAAVPGSALQERLLRKMVARGRDLQCAGYGMAKYLSAGRALVRRGLAWTYRTGWYGAEKAGVEWVKSNPPNSDYPHQKGE